MKRYVRCSKIDLMDLSSYKLSDAIEYMKSNHAAICLWNHLYLKLNSGIKGVSLCLYDTSVDNLVVDLDGQSISYIEIIRVTGNDLIIKNGHCETIYLCELAMHDIIIQSALDVRLDGPDFKCNSISLPSKLKYLDLWADKGVIHEMNIPENVCIDNKYSGGQGGVFEVDNLHLPNKLNPRSKKTCFKYTQWYNDYREVLSNS